MENTEETSSTMEEAFRKAAEAADNGQPFELPSAQETEDRAPVEAVEETSSTNPDSIPEKAEAEAKPDRPRDEKGRFIKNEAGEDIPEELREEAPPEEAKEPEQDGIKKEESKYAKVVKDLERLNRNRQEFEEEKRRDREMLAQEKRRLEQERQEFERARAPQTSAPKYSSQEYSEFAREAQRKARDLFKEGDLEEAEAQQELADKASAEAGRAYEYEVTTQQQQQAAYYQNQWVKNMEDTIKAEPDLGKANSVLSQRVVKLMQDNPNLFEHVPHGFEKAAEVAKLQLKAEMASGLEAENQKLKAEIKTLNERTSISRGGPTSPVSEQTLEQMTTEQREDYFRRSAAAIDGA